VTDSVVQDKCYSTSSQILLHDWDLPSKVSASHEVTGVELSNQERVMDVFSQTVHSTINIELATYEQYTAAF